MMQRFLIPLLLTLCLIISTPVRSETSVQWLDWHKDLFEKAQAANKFVILDLEAVWCHWCHVMEEKTYANPEVKALLARKYLTVRVDQDANPDLSNRYGDWGWPATIIFAPDGSEIVKLRGYIPAPRMIALLQAVIDDPSPGPSVLNDPALNVRPSQHAYLKAGQRSKLLKTYRDVYDEKNGGWGDFHKFIHTESMDYALFHAEKGDKGAAAKARQTLDAALALIDPVWGGVYQYSDKVNWKSPHYEKIMSYQAHYMRHYAQAFAIWRDPAYLKAARDIHRYLSTFLTSPVGAFYTSQDADLSRSLSGKDFYGLNDKERRKHGTPWIDKNLYARENGWAISGFIALYHVIGDQRVLDQAKRAMAWVLENRQLAGGGFKHGADDRGGPYLGDTLAMGQAGLDLYAATGERKWLQLARRAGVFIGQTFKHKEGGFVTAAKSEAEAGVFLRPVRQIEENIQVTRFFNVLHRYSGDNGVHALGEHGMRYLASDAIISLRRFLIGVVLADEEMSIEPAHITIVGHKNDERAKALHAAARQLPMVYKRIDWWDKREGAMINPDVTYPELEEPAAFACANSVCSLPVFNPEHLRRQVKKMMALRVNERQGN